MWYLVHGEKISFLEDELRKKSENPEAAPQLLKKSRRQSIPATDWKAIHAMTKRLNELREELDDIKNDPIRQEKLMVEIEEIRARLAADRGIRGRIRQETKGQCNCRTSFSNAIKRVIDRIRETDAPFADYLKKSVRCGANPIYQPPSPIQWETDPVFNPER